MDEQREERKVAPWGESQEPGFRSKQKIEHPWVTISEFA